MTRALSECDQCGQVDDHPKAHIGDERGVVSSKHHDCLAAREKDLLTASAQLPGAVKASAVIRECAENGRRGDDLLAFILSDHKKADLAVGSVQASAPEGPMEIVA